MRTAIILLLMVLLSSCAPLVSRCAFFPKKIRHNTELRVPGYAREIFITTKDRKKLQCFFVQNDTSNSLLIYFHGNAGNIYQRLPELHALSRLGINVLGVGYRGYGRSTGRPSESGIYTDGAAALQYAVDSLHYSFNDIVIFGRSIGTTAAIHTAMNRSIAGLILVTPLTNSKEYLAFHGFGFVSFLAGCSFNNVEKIKQVQAPVLIIHGTSDEVVSIESGRELYDAAPRVKKMIEIENGYHNTLELTGPVLYWGGIREFIKSNR